MIESYYIGAYWGVRKEAARECARRMNIFLATLQHIDATFVEWFHGGRSRKEALSRPFILTEENLTELLLEGRSHDDFGYNVLEELGFRTALWNGDEQGEDIALSVLCGSTASIPGVNSCVIDLPYEGVTAERLLRVSSLIEIMKCIASAWEPDWGVVNSRSYREMAPKQCENSPLVGWITYLSSSRGRIPSLPSPSYSIEVDNLGSLIVVTNEQFTASDSQHVEAAKRTQNVLSHANLLGPLH